VHLRSATRGKKAATIRNYQDALRPVQERLGAVPLQKLTTAHVEDLVDWMLSSGRKRGGKPGTGLSPSSVQLTLSRLRSLLDDAVHRRSAPVKCPAQVRTQREPWTEQEVRQFLASLTGHRLHATMLLALLGLRPAEVCGLRWPDVDLDSETLKVTSTRTLVATNEGMVVVEKDRNPPAAGECSRSQRKSPRRCAHTRLYKPVSSLRRDRPTPPTGYVLVDELGRRAELIGCGVGLRIDGCRRSPEGSAL
jgi:integrase